MAKDTTPVSLAVNIAAGLNPEDWVGGYRELKKGLGLSEHVARKVSKLLKERSGIPAKRAAPSPLVDVVPEMGGGGSYMEMPDGRYIFEWEDRGVQRSLVISEAELKSLILAYTKDGDNQTMQVTATKHGLTRRDFHKVKTIYGATKDHEPFTLKELVERPVADLADEHLALKRRHLMQTVEKEDYRRVQEDARKWIAFSQGVLDPLADMVESLVGARPSPERPNLSWTPRSGYITLYQGSDLHFGLTVEGGQYNRQMAKERYASGLWQAVEHGRQSYGDPDYILLYIGGDVAHVDNMQGATSSMRHTQDMDGTPDTIIQGIAEMYLAEVDALLAQGERIHVACVPGNHDELISRACASILWAAYRNNGNVSFGNLTGYHSYEVYGKNAIVGHHGHGEKTAPSLGANLGSWLRNAGLSVPYHYAITGNLHHLAAKEDAGCILIQQPSPAPADRYHTKNGYDSSRRATVGLYFGKEEGLLSIRYIGF